MRCDDVHRPRRSWMAHAPERYHHDCRIKLDRGYRPPCRPLVQSIDRLRSRRSRAVLGLPFWDGAVLSYRCEQVKTNPSHIDSFAAGGVKTNPSQNDPERHKARSGASSAAPPLGLFNTLDSPQCIYSSLRPLCPPGPAERAQAIDAPGRSKVFSTARFHALTESNGSPPRTHNG